MSRRLFELDPIALLFYSLATLYRELPMWIHLNLLGLLFTLPLVTAGAARSGVHFAVRLWVLDRIDGDYTIRKAFFEGFRYHFWRGTLVGVLNMFCLGIIAFAIWFWLASPITWLNYMAVIGFYALFLWIGCQPYIYPVCVSTTDNTPPDVMWLALKLLFSTPLYTLLLVLVLFGVNLIAIILLGPILLVLDVFIAILTTQALWIITDEPLPRLNKQEG